MSETVETREVTQIVQPANPVENQPEEHTTIETITHTSDTDEDEEGVAWLEERLAGLEGTLSEMRTLLEATKEMLLLSMTENRELRTMLQSQTETLTSLATASILASQLSSTPEPQPESQTEPQPEMPPSVAVVNPEQRTSLEPQALRKRRRI